MKLKEVCAETGLSRKTIRLYEEKGLLVPRKEYRNGRDYREYTPEDVRQLQIIAMLRRAWFTMEEIRKMQEDPGKIREVFEQYRQWLFAQKRELDGLIAVAKTVEIDKVETIAQLTEEMSSAAERLPLPHWDIRPRFQHLDRLEEEVRDMGKQKDKNDELRTFRQTALVMDQDKGNNQAITFGRIREIRSGELWQETAVVQKEEQLGKPLRMLSTLGGILTLVGLLVFVGIYLGRILGLFSSDNSLPPAAFWAMGVFVVGVVLYGCIRGYAAWLERKRWIERMRQQDLEKERNRNQE